MMNQQTTSWPELTAILLGRLGFLWVLVFVSLLIPGDDTAFYALMGIAFIITIPYSLWLRNKLRASQFAPLQFIVDVLLVTGLVYFTGGVHSNLILLYPLVILSAGIVGTPRQAAEITALAVITYFLMATLLSNKWIVEYTPAQETAELNSGGAALPLHGVMFTLFGIASIYVSKRCNYAGNLQNDLFNTFGNLLENIPCPALLLDYEGKILRSNGAAYETLEQNITAIEGKLFADLCTEPAEPIPESFGKTACLKRPGSKPLPVAFASSEFRTPETALYGALGRQGETTTVTLLTFNDISDALNTGRQLKKVERITAATRIAGEMAHEIRTPLTAISASVQLLLHYEEKATAADWLPNSSRRRDRKELFNHIAHASKQMDDVVKNFIDFAEFSPADLLSIIKLDSLPENQGYIGHLNMVGRGIRDGENSDSG